MKLKSFENPPLFSQKNASTVNKTQSFGHSSYFISSFCSCYVNENDSKIFGNHQNIENLKDPRHYTERINGHDNKSFLINLQQETLKKSSINENLQKESLNHKNSHHKSQKNQKKKNFFNEKNPEFCVIQHNRKVLLAKIAVYSVHLKKIVKNSEKKNKISMNSNEEGFFKYHKEETRMNCTLASNISHNQTQNPSINSPEKAIDNKIFYDLDSKPSKILQKITAHIAKKIKKSCNLIIDAYTRTGIPAIEFARNGFQVISLNKNLHFCKILRQNSTLFSLKDKINVIQGDFHEMKGLKCDVVFFNPSYHSYVENLSFEEGLSIFENISPDISMILEKALEISNNIVMVFSDKADISELASLFWKYFEKKGDLQRISINIELMKFNGKLEAFIVYVGEISEIRISDEKNFFEIFLLREHPLDFRLKNPQFSEFLEKLMPITLYRIYNKHLTENWSYKQSLYFQFLLVCFQENRLKKQQYESFINYEKNYLEIHQVANKTTFFSDKNTNESMSQKILMNNLEIFTFSKFQSLPSESDEIKQISDEESLVKNSGSPYFKGSYNLKQIHKEEYDENELNNVEDLESEKNEFEEFMSPSLYSGQILNSLSQASFENKGKIGVIVANSLVEKSDKFPAGNSNKLKSVIKE